MRQQQLERLGLLVTATRSPIEGRGLATQSGAFDVVLTDMRMPDLDGVDLAAAIRAAMGPASPPVIVLSSVGERDHDVEGVAAYLAKPVKPGALRDVVTAALGGTVRVAAKAREGSQIDPALGLRHPLSVLLAEDNAVNVKLALRLLERMGYTADVAANGLEAIDAVERVSYDLVLMDVQMPELDGLEATREIRRRWPDRPIRIVAMTANAMQGDRERCLAAGMDDYVSKPIRPDELAAALVAAPAGSIAAS